MTCVEIIEQGRCNLLKNDKIRINWNKNPVRMDLFLSFLTVPVSRSHSHLGSDTGWTQLRGDDGLVVGGGIVNQVEYLDSIQYKKNLHNAYNNYVTPLHLFDIISYEGKEFFLKYYEEEICAIVRGASEKTIHLQAQLDAARRIEQEVSTFWSALGITTEKEVSCENNQ